MTDTTQDDDFYPATAGDDPIWLGGVEYITKSRSDDLVQTAVAAKLREAAGALFKWGDIYGDNAALCVLALIPKEKSDD
jgi:hypothetical protein